MGVKLTLLLPPHGLLTWGPAAATAALAGALAPAAVLPLARAA